MKKGASMFFKNIISLLTSVTRSKSMAIKSKAEAIKARFIMFSLLKKKKKFPLILMSGSISRKIHSLLLGGNATTSGDPQHEDLDIVNEAAVHVDDTQSVLHGKAAISFGCVDDDDDDDDKYPDLRHSLFEEEEDYDDLDLGDPNASVIELVKNSKEHDGEDFSLEGEIDLVADLFIMKFHKKMRLQKLESFKRYQEMLERSA